MTTKTSAKKTTQGTRAAVARSERTRPASDGTRGATTKAGANGKARPRVKVPPKATTDTARAPNDVSTVLHDLERSASSAYRADMTTRYGIVTSAPVYGVPVGALRAMAKTIGRDHVLADELWRTGVHDARMLATMVADPEHITSAQMQRWSTDFDNWALVDTACFGLFDRSPHAFAHIDKWSTAENEYVKRAAFALLACCALHGRGSDADHLRGLELLEREASDARNFVKKGVSWALRSIGGKKSTTLRAAARSLAKRLAKSTDPTERWIGKDALRAFAKASG